MRQDWDSAPHGWNFLPGLDLCETKRSHRLPPINCKEWLVSLNQRNSKAKMKLRTVIFSQKLWRTKQTHPFLDYGSSGRTRSPPPPQYGIASSVSNCSGVQTHCSTRSNVSRGTPSGDTSLRSWGDKLLWRNVFRGIYTLPPCFRVIHSRSVTFSQ